MKLYNYYRSSASYRVRIALNLKNIHYDTIDINLLPAVNEQQTESYLNLNPQGMVPTLNENGHILTQSMAILEYIEEICPTPSLFPSTPLGRACVRSLAMIIACDIHPLNNLRVLQQLQHQFQASEDQMKAWYHLWLKKGFDAFERKLQNLPRKNSVCYGSEVSVADICLVPQVYNAKRFEFAMEDYPLINEINAYCLSLKAFSHAAP